MGIRIPDAIDRGALHPPTQHVHGVVHASSAHALAYIFVTAPDVLYSCEQKVCGSAALGHLTQPICNDGMVLVRMFSLVLCILFGCASHAYVCASSRPCDRQLGLDCVEYTLSYERSHPAGCRDSNPLPIIEYRKEEDDGGAGGWKRLISHRELDSKLC